MATNDIVTRSDDHMGVDMSMAADGAVLTSIDMTKPEGKAAVFGALQNAGRVEDHLNETINLTGFVAQRVSVPDAKTGELTPATKTILIDDAGNGYAATSNGILGSLNTLISIYGDPTAWEGPVAIKVVEKRSNAGRKFYTIIPA